MILYKYRSIENFQYFVDIILNKRLYAASYFDMNDPMEGYYIYSSQNPSADVINKLMGEKKRLRIVSLSKKCDNLLMWSHYANGHHGVAIGVEVDTDIYDLRQVDYLEDLLSIHDNDVNEILRTETAKTILSKKHYSWSYEDEERIFIEDGNKYADVSIKEIILGNRMTLENQRFIRKLVEKLVPDVIVRNSEVGRS